MGDIAVERVARPRNAFRGRNWFLSGPKALDSEPRAQEPGRGKRGRRRGRSRANFQTHRKATGPEDRPYSLRTSHGGEGYSPNDGFTREGGPPCLSSFVFF